MSIVPACHWSPVFNHSRRFFDHAWKIQSTKENEMFYGCEKDDPSFEAFQNAIAEYMDDYNRRIQAKTKWMPPFKLREASMMKC